MSKFKYFINGIAGLGVVPMLKCLFIVNLYIHVLSLNFMYGMIFIYQMTGLRSCNSSSIDVCNES